MKLSELRRQRDEVLSRKSELSKRATELHCEIPLLPHGDRKRRQLGIELNELNKKLSALNAVSKRLAMRIVECEIAAKEAAHTTMADHFVKIARDRLPTQTFDEWMAIAGVDFARSFELTGEEIGELA